LLNHPDKPYNDQCFANDISTEVDTTGRAKPFEERVAAILRLQSKPPIRLGSTFAEKAS
jgi:hypothetical protein